MLQRGLRAIRWDKSAGHGLQTVLFVAWGRRGDALCMYHMPRDWQWRYRDVGANCAWIRSVLVHQIRVNANLNRPLTPRSSKSSVKLLLLQLTVLCNRCRLSIPDGTEDVLSCLVEFYRNLILMIWVVSPKKRLKKQKCETTKSVRLFYFNREPKTET